MEYFLQALDFCWFMNWWWEKNFCKFWWICLETIIICMDEAHCFHKKTNNNFRKTFEVFSAWGIVKRIYYNFLIKWKIIYRRSCYTCRKSYFFEIILQSYHESFRLIKLKNISLLVWLNVFLTPMYVQLWKYFYKKSYYIFFIWF